MIAGGAVRPPAYFRTPTGRLLQRLGLARDYEGGAQATVAALGLDGAVRFLPFTGEAEEVYRASDLVVAPSQGPEIGRSLIEAAATGVAAVGSGSTTGGGVLEPGVTTMFTAGSTRRRLPRRSAPCWQIPPVAMQWGPRRACTRWPRSTRGGSRRRSRRSTNALSLRSICDRDSRPQRVPRGRSRSARHRRRACCGGRGGAFQPRQAPAQASPRWRRAGVSRRPAWSPAGSTTSRSAATRGRTSGRRRADSRHGLRASRSPAHAFAMSHASGAAASGRRSPRHSACPSRR